MSSLQESLYLPLEEAFQAANSLPEPVMNEPTSAQLSSMETSRSIDLLVSLCHGASEASGWWTHQIETPEGLIGLSMKDPVYLQIHNIVPTKLALVHSEVSEALEGFRKGSMDEHLPQHASLTVELADAIIRICDLAGALELPLGPALVEKLEYNARRADHKAAHRAAAGGKKF